jgi:drug/metabolite transporter superfamily protein YnfA
MIAEKYTDYMYDLIDKVMKTIGPRESCSDQEKRLGRMFADEVADCCDRVESETFTCSPTAFVGFFPFLVIMYIAAVVLFFFVPPISCLIAVVAFVVIIAEVVRYKELIDPIWPKRDGENVLGFIEPRKDATRRVYVSGHLDSAYEFKIWYWFKGASAAVMGAGAFVLVLLFGFSLAASIAKPVGLPSSTVYWAFGFILVGLTPLIGLFWFFHTDDVVPGAMDDMAAVAVLAGLGRYFKEARVTEGFYPETTEVVLLALSSEEAGLRGAKRFAASHKGDALPACGIFLDGIYDEDFFTVFEKELWPGAVMDPEMVTIAKDAAKEMGVKLEVGNLPLGATDASAFALAGIPAASLCLSETKRLVPHYHTRLDTIDNIKPHSLAVALQATIEMLRIIDEKA